MTTNADDARRRCAWLPLANGAAHAIARLPQPLLLACGAALAWLGAPLLRKRRRYARVNLALCFPELDDRARARLQRATWRATITGLLELLRAWFAPRATVARLVDVAGLEHVHAARAQGRGVLLLTGHFPHSELGGRALADALGLPLAVVVRRNAHPCMERWMDAARRRAFADTIGKKDVRALLRTLSRGGLVAYSADQNFTYQNAFVPFFGVQASTLVATSDIARRSGAVVLPYWFLRGDDGRYRLWIEPPWDGWPSDDPAADAARYMRELERVVRLRPEQYLWVHRRFKTRPPGEPDVYR
ncbi:MAG TPA: lipid A biosynthesis lauroyl acyltransferase [Xanthomonadaceae bacterium]|nr:lipid A biosynthesis lauroyl acyltransferase [Xanthomonadaceae bacterium]